MMAETLQSIKYRDNSVSVIRNITALWAFSESALGGFLHAGRLPFSGLFISSAAVIFISLIGYYSQKRWTILNATLTVLIVKGLISPHTPPNAYFAVLFQGAAGELLFAYPRFYRPAAFTLGIVCLLQSALQKLFIITLVFGFTFWDSIDIFTAFIIKQLPFIHLETYSIHLSLYLIIFYVALHLFAGILAGWFAGILPTRMQKQKKYLDELATHINLREETETNRLVRKKRWWKRPKKIALFLFLVILIIISYFDSSLHQSQFIKTVIMVIRSLLIMNLWFFFISPIIMKYFNLYMDKKKNMREGDVQIIMHSLPQIKMITKACWNYSARYKYIKRFFTFMELLFMFTVNIKAENDE